MPNRSTLAGFAAILLWSSTVALSRSISEQIGPLWMVFAVYTMGGLVLGLGTFFRNRGFHLSGGKSALSLGRGALFVTYIFSLSTALGLAADRLQAVEIGLLNYLWPSLTLLTALLLLKKKASLWLIPGTLLALAGIVLVFTQGSGITWASFNGHILTNPISYGLGLLAAVSWAFYSNLTRRWNGSASAWDMPAFLLASGLGFGLVALIAKAPLTLAGPTIFEIILLALFTAAGYMLWDLAMQRGDLVLVAAVSYLTPLFSTLVSTLYLRVTPGLMLWAGCLLIIAGSFVSWRSFEDSRQP
jgi:drug/metabolite transporter (DMT)-like permease